MSTLFDKIELPTMPQVISRIMDIDEHKLDISFDQLATIISSDPGLISKILKLANSPFYSRVNNVIDLNQAIKLLGFKSIKSLTLLVSISRLIPNVKQHTVIQNELWMRSIIKGLIAREIAIKTGHRKLAESAFMAALMRNIGQLIIHSRFPTIYEDIFHQSDNGLNYTKIGDLENEAFGITTGEMTLSAMKKWNLPEELVTTAERRIDDTRSDAGGLPSIIACFSEVVLFINELTEKITLNDEKKDYFKGLFNEYSEKLSLEGPKKDYFIGKITSTFEDDNLYNFCEEIFSN